MRFDNRFTSPSLVSFGNLKIPILCAISTCFSYLHTKQIIGMFARWYNLLAQWARLLLKSCHFESCVFDPLKASSMVNDSIFSRDRFVCALPFFLQRSALHVRPHWREQNEVLLKDPFFSFSFGNMSIPHPLHFFGSIGRAIRHPSYSKFGKRKIDVIAGVRYASVSRSMSSSSEDVCGQEPSAVTSGRRLRLFYPALMRNPEKV